MLFFHHKSSFCSQDIYYFVFDFLVMYKNGLIRKIRLISKFMMFTIYLQPGKQTAAIDIVQYLKM